MYNFLNFSILAYTSMRIGALGFNKVNFPQYYNFRYSKIVYTNYIFFTRISSYNKNTRTLKKKLYFRPIKFNV